MQVFEDSLVSQEHPGTTVSPPAIATCPLVQVSEDSPVSQEHPKTTVTVLPPAVAICSLVQASIRGFPCVPRTSWDYCITTCIAICLPPVQVSKDSPVSQEHPGTTVSPPIAICLPYLSIQGFSGYTA